MHSILILITLKLEQMYKNKKATILVFFILFSYSYLFDSLVQKWEEP